MANMYPQGFSGELLRNTAKVTAEMDRQFLGQNFHQRISCASVAHSQVILEAPRTQLSHESQVVELHVNPRLNLAELVNTGTACGVIWALPRPQRVSEKIQG